MKRRTNQGGSIAMFIVIGVILASVLLGAVYFLNKHGDQVRKDQTIAANEKKQTENKSNASNNSSSTDTTKNGGSSTNNSSASVDSGKLPASGNELSIVNLLAVFLLATMATAFILSRKNNLRSL